MPRYANATALLIVISAACAYLWIHRQPDSNSWQAEIKSITSAKIAEATEPASNAFASRQANTLLPETGISVAGSELDLRTLAACHQLLLTKKYVEQSGCDKVEVGNAPALEQCRAQIADVTLRLQELTAGAAPCPENLAEPSTYYLALRSRAQAGDTAAQRCFISGHFGQSGEEKKNLTQAEVAEYVALAKVYIEGAFERGDWSVVRWLGRIRLNINDGLLVQAYPIGQLNPETIYRMKYLLTLGKQPDPIEGVDPQHIVEGWRRDMTLTPEQFRNAEVWARTLYAQHFDSSQEQAKAGLMDFCPAN